MFYIRNSYHCTRIDVLRVKGNIPLAVMNSINLPTFLSIEIAKCPFLLILEDETLLQKSVAVFRSRVETFAW